MDIQWNDPAYVYLVKCGKLYKIGKAINVGQRLKELSTGSAYPLFIKHTIQSLAAQRLEHWLHQRFRPWRVRGEWFELPLNSVRWITSKSGPQLDRYMAHDEVCDQCHAREFTGCYCQIYPKRVPWAPHEKMQLWSRKGELLERCNHCGRWFQSRATELYCLECRAAGDTLDRMGCLPEGLDRTPSGNYQINPALWRKKPMPPWDDDLPF